MEMAEKPWESRTVEQDIKSEDEEAIKTVEVYMGIQKPCPHSQSPTFCDPDQHYPERAYPAPGSHHSPEKISVPSLHCCASPRSCGRHLNFNEKPQTPEKLGSGCSSIFDDFSYMAATESASARACPQSPHRQRPETPEKERRSSVKRRLIFHAMETSSVASPTMPYRSPTLKGSSLRVITGPIMTERSSMSSTGSNKKDETKPSSVGDLRKWLR